MMNELAGVCTSAGSFCNTAERFFLLNLLSWAINSVKTFLPESGSNCPGSNNISKISHLYFKEVLMNTTTVVTKQRLQRRPVSWRLRAGVMMLLVLFLAAITWGEVSAQTETPEMDVQGNGISIADGDVTPSTSDGTDFGSAGIGNPTLPYHTVTIINNGSLALNLSGSPQVQISGTNAADFIVSAQPSSPVAPSGSTTFTVCFAPNALGLRTAIVSITNDDADENPYDFVIQGTGTGASEIDVTWNFISIVNGDNTPSTSDGTDFGAAEIGGDAVYHYSFIILNKGNISLYLTGSPHVPFFLCLLPSIVKLLITIYGILVYYSRPRCPA
jgi:hypothetical protein